jgi:hypothetical protein
MSIISINLGIDGIIKLAIETIKESKGKKKKYRHLSESLERIANHFDKARSRFEKREIPKEEAVALDIIIERAKDLAKPFKKRYPQLAEVFDSLLPEIHYQMQLADYVIDGKPRGDVKLSDDKKNIQLYFTPENQIEIATNKLSVASSILREHSQIFKQEGE